jgi:putative hemolysin
MAQRGTRGLKQVILMRTKVVTEKTRSTTEEASRQEFNDVQLWSVGAYVLRFLERDWFQGLIPAEAQPYISRLLLGLFLDHVAHRPLSKRDAMKLMNTVDGRTSQRYLSLAQEHGLVTVSQSIADKRVDLIAATEKLLTLVRSELTTIGADMGNLRRTVETRSKSFFLPRDQAAAEPPPLSEFETLEFRLARTPLEIRCAQQLRAQILYDSAGKPQSPAARIAQRDFDQLDPYCEHILFIENGSKFDGVNEQLVGTTRLLRQEMADKHGGFNVGTEFDVRDLISRHPKRRFLEFGRTCALAPYANERVAKFWWQSIRAFAEQAGADVIIGFTSFHKSDPKSLTFPLAFLHHLARAPEAWRVWGLPSGDRVRMNHQWKNILTPEAKKAQLELLRNHTLLRHLFFQGGYFSEEAVIDKGFGTVDLMVVLPLDEIKPRDPKHPKKNGPPD